MREPDFKGVDSTRAWLVATPRPPSNPDWKATLAQWAVYQPGANPLWSWWIFSVIHLRDVEGQSKPPIMRHKDASHEFIAFACDPETDVDPDNPETFRHLTPLDLAHQVVGLNDDQAIDIGVVAVRRVMTNMASFDADHASMWKTILDNTVRCELSGSHAGRLS